MEMKSEACAAARGQITETMDCFSAVINSPELLESILLQLDLRTLLTSAQLVCRYWQELIQKSPSLQRVLFLLPADSSEVENDERQFNPLLEASFPTWFNNRMRIDVATDFDIDMLWAKTRLAVFLRPAASWRRMLVCQPPAYTLGTVEVTCVQRWSSRAVRVRKPISGVRMGDLLDQCLDSYELPELQVFWASQMQQVDDRWRRLASDVWPQVERARMETDILIFRASFTGCEDTDVEAAYEDIARFVKGFRPSTPQNDEDKYIKIENDGWWD